MAGKRGCSAATGRFVKQSTVKIHPKTATNESEGRRGKKKSAASKLRPAQQCQWQ